MNRTPEILFALLIAMMIVVVTFWWIEPTPQGQGFNHRAYPEETLQQAPESWERHRSVIAGATCFWRSGMSDFRGRYGARPQPTRAIRTGRVVAHGRGCDLYGLVRDGCDALYGDHRRQATVVWATVVWATVVWATVVWATVVWATVVWATVVWATRRLSHRRFGKRPRPRPSCYWYLHLLPWC